MIFGLRELVYKKSQVLLCVKYVCPYRQSSPYSLCVCVYVSSVQRDTLYSMHLFLCVFASLDIHFAKKKGHRGAIHLYRVIDEEEEGRMMIQAEVRNKIRGAGGNFRCDCF